MSRNNVHVSGTVVSEQRINQSSKVEVKVGINENGMILPVITIVELNDWEKFKRSFPKKYLSVTISGQLQSFRDESGTYQTYSIIANGISLFHNLLADSLDETESKFHGPVILKKKFEFDTASNLFLKRMVFETLGNHKPAIIEAMALRGAAPYFDDIKEGTEMILKANYVIDKNGNPPYWRIKHQPETIL